MTDDHEIDHNLLDSLSIDHTQHNLSSDLKTRSKKSIPVRDDAFTIEKDDQKDEDAHSIKSKKRIEIE